MNYLKKRYLLLFIVVFFLSCNFQTSPKKNNVILIIVDTLRADHLSCYGAKSKVSPSIDSLAENGVQFLNAYTTAPWTQPAVASIITGLLPYYHNVCDLFDILDSKNTTLAEILHKEGYRTGGIVSHELLESKLGYSQGFDYYNEKNIGGESVITSSKITADAIEWIKGNKDNNFFLMLHYFDPHYAYRHHEEFDYAKGYTGSLKEGDDIWELRAKKDDMNEEDINFLKNLYDEEISYTDKNIGILLDYLKNNKLMDNSIIVFTADHGEEFTDHGWLGHTIHLYEELVHIPLLFHIPGNDPSIKISRNVSVTDIVPTILDLLKIDYDKSSFNGNSLVDYMNDKKPKEDENPVFFQVSFAVNEGINLRAKQKFSVKNGVLFKNLKLIEDIANEKTELYDVDEDGDEKNNLIKTNPEIYKKLKTLLDGSPIRNKDKAGSSKNKLTPSKKQIESLKSLGYLQ